MIICSKCSKENQDRYKFCLGCGSPLTAPAAAPPPAAPESVAANTPLPFTPVSPTPPAGIPKFDIPSDVAAPDGLKFLSEETEPGAPIPSYQSDIAEDPIDPAEQAAIKEGHGSASDMVRCLDCGTPNPREFVFCGNCGSRIKGSGQATIGIAGSAIAPSAKVWGKLALIKPDGSEGGTHPINAPETLIGRSHGPLFNNDSYLNPNQARLYFDNGELLIQDSGSLNGVFLKISQDEPLHNGDVFRIGQELLRFDIIHPPQPLEDGTEIMGSPNPGYRGRLSIIVGPNVDGSAFPLMGEETILGRERGDILFSDDGYVSGTHAKIFFRQCFFLSDFGSSNGTFIKIIKPRTVVSGAYILLGQQLFRIDYE